MLDHVALVARERFDQVRVAAIDGDEDLAQGVSAQAPSCHRNICPLSIPFLPTMCFPLRRAKEGPALAFDAFLKADIHPVRAEPMRKF